jgi:hypothetical protein
MNDLELAFEVLKRKGERYSRLWDYYDGRHPQRYNASRLAELFRRVDANFSENWCGVVVDSVLERVNLLRFVVGEDEALTSRLEMIWKGTEMDLQAWDVHLDALVTGEGFVMAGLDENGELESYVNDSRLVAAFYDAEKPNRMRMAAKWWLDMSAGGYRLNLYYPERIEYYASPKSDLQTSKAFTEYQPAAENPYGLIPVFHFRRERRGAISELDNVIPIQDAVNKLVADMMVSAEFGAFKQRYVISNADGLGSLRNAPNEVWTIPAGDGVGQGSTAGQFESTELGNYLSGIEHFVSAISTISKTPGNYFFKNQSHAPSGEALIAMESPLNHKCQRMIEMMGNTWESVGRFLLETYSPRDLLPQPLSLKGEGSKKGEVRAVFEKPETVQPRTRAEIRQMNVTSGIPLVTSLRDEGWSDSQIRQMELDKDGERQAQQTSLAQALVTQQRNFDRGRA